MYWLELVNTILSNEEEKPVITKPQTRHPDSGYRKDFKSAKKSFDRPDSSYASKSVKKESAYCLFATSGQSFEAMYKNQKMTILLKGIELPDKNNYISKKANYFINEQIKKKPVFLGEIETIDSNTIRAEVYLDAQKTLSLNQLMIEQNLHKVQKRSYPSYEKNTLNDTKKEDSPPATEKINHISTNNISSDISSGPVINEEQEMNHVNHLLAEAQHEGDTAPIDYGWSEQSAPMEYEEEYSPPYDWESAEEKQPEIVEPDNHEPKSEPFHEEVSPVEPTPTMDDILSVFDSPPNIAETSENSLNNMNNPQTVEKKTEPDVEQPVIKKTRGFGLIR